MIKVLLASLLFGSLANPGIPVGGLVNPSPPPNLRRSLTTLVTPILVFQEYVFPPN